MLTENVSSTVVAASTSSIAQWLKWFCEGGGGVTWRSQVGANPIPVPTPLIWRYYGRTLSDASMLYFADVFLYFFMRTLVGQTAERIFTKLSHVVDIAHHLRTY